jgi:hypothetical protein
MPEPNDHHARLLSPIPALWRGDVPDPADVNLDTEADDGGSADAIRR